MRVLNYRWYVKSLTTSLRPPPVKIAYLGFPGSILVNPKHFGTGYVSSGHASPISRPNMTFQSRCDTPRVSAWCHQNPLMTSLRPPPIKIAYLGFPSSVFANSKHAGPGCAICGPISSISTCQDIPVQLWRPPRRDIASPKSTCGLLTTSSGQNCIT